MTAMADDLVDRYEGLIRSGTFTAASTHSVPDRRMVAEILGELLAKRTGAPLRVLDAGCGPGEWLLAIDELARGEGIDDVRLSGFDVVPGMVELARARLGGAGRSADVRVGDILDRATYGAADEGGWDLIFTFDVVQQLPRDVQFRAVESLVSALRPGGVLAMFDHDRETASGRKMGLKKWLTRHGPYPFVPRWYIHAAYPRLERFARRLAAPGRRGETRGGSGTPRRALIVERDAG
jgi:SAM-dependent methyltransferase